MRRALAALALSAALLGERARGATPAEAARGTYRLRGTVRVEAGPALSRTVEGRADAILRPSGGPRALRARLASQGHACELDGTVEPGGAVVFAAGQRCAIDLDDEGARGHVDARLRAGRGALRGGRLSLDLTFELSGAVSLRTGRRIEVLGRTVEVPDASMPEVPVSGTAHAVAEGDLDHSRGAEP